MHISKDAVPVKISLPGATARQQLDFGDTTGFAKLSGEYFSLQAGIDITPLLKGLDHDLCQCPHWGYMIAGEVRVTYTDGGEESAAASDLFYWPPGHTVKVLEDAEIILFSPQEAHSQVIEHMKKRFEG